MLSTLETTRANQIIDMPAASSTYGLDKPRLTVTLRKGGKEVEAVKFGRESANPIGVYVKGSAVPVMGAPKDLYDRFNVKMSDLVEAKPSSPTPSK